MRRSYCLRIHQKQYEIGIEAGKDLAKMHTYEAPNHTLPWYERAMKTSKICRGIQNMRNKNKK